MYGPMASSFTNDLLTPLQEGCIIVDTIYFDNRYSQYINTPYYYYWSGTKHLERMATALALTKQRFSLPYSSARTTALALLELVARREARSAKDSIASVPQAPYASTTMGTQTHPSSLHLASFSSCFLSSVALAA